MGSLGRVKVAGLVLGMLSSRPPSSPASPPLGQRARASKAFSPLLTSHSDGAGPDKAHRQLWTSIRVGEATVRGVKGGWSWTCPASRRGIWGGSRPWTSPLPGANSQRSVQLPAAAVTLAKMDRLIISNQVTLIRTMFFSKSFCPQFRTSLVIDFFHFLEQSSLCFEQQRPILSLSGRCSYLTTEWCGSSLLVELFKQRKQS